MIAVQVTLLIDNPNGSYHRRAKQGMCTGLSSNGHHDDVALYSVVTPADNVYNNSQRDLNKVNSLDSF